MIFSPNSPRRFDVELPFEPRAVHPVFYQGDGRLVVLMPLAMETVREYSSERCVESPLARRNLRVWLDTLGEALYNPVMWHYHPEAKLKPWSFEIRGMHRTRVLKALDFDFMYIYLVLGSYSGLPVDVVKAMRRNTRNPTTSTYASVCEKCGVTIDKYFKTEDLTRFYRCRSCGFEGFNQMFYPEPV